MPADRVRGSQGGHPRAELGRGRRAFAARALKLVIDASVAAAAAANPVGFERFRRFELVAPPLMWIEAVSTLHAMLWRGELRREQGRADARPGVGTNARLSARHAGCANAARDRPTGLRSRPDRAGQRLTAHAVFMARLADVGSPPMGVLGIGGKGAQTEHHECLECLCGPYELTRPRDSRRGPD